MKTEIKWRSNFPIVDTHSVSLTNNSVTVIFEDKEGKKVLEINGPGVHEKGHLFLNECSEIRVIDRNITEGYNMDYGRWKIVIWDEDNPIEEFECDEFSTSDLTEATKP